jgi:hypothetical protein
VHRDDVGSLLPGSVREEWVNDQAAAFDAL